MSSPSSWRPDARVGALILTLILASLGALSGACGGALYELPPPVPESAREDVSLIPGEDDRARERDYLEARAAILKLYQYLSSKRFKEALELMSEGTIEFLTFTSSKPSSPDAPVTTLAEGRLVMRDGQVILFDPVALLLAKDVSKLEDELPGQKEQETSRRKEIFAVEEDGQIRKIVVIKEAGRWVIHKTSAPQAR